MTEIATIDWFGGWGTSVFSENTAIFLHYSKLVWIQNESFQNTLLKHKKINFFNFLPLWPRHLEESLLG